MLVRDKTRKKINYLKRGIIMKKRILSLILTVMLVLSATSITAFAADKFETNVMINGKFVTSEMASGQGWSYDNSAATLTLNGFNGAISSDWLDNNLKSLKIRLVGDNTVNTGDGDLTLRYISDVIFEGTGSLTIKGNKAADSYSDAVATFTGVTFNGGTINITSDRNVGISSERDIVFNAGTLNISAAKYPILSNGGLVKIPEGVAIDGVKFIKYDRDAGEYVECSQAEAQAFEKSGAFTISKAGATKEIKVLDSKNTEWTPGSKEGVVIRFDMDIKDFVKLVINGNEVDKKYYTLKEGSTIVTISNDYLKTLANGTYDVEAHSVYGVAKASFTVSGNTLSPNTGATTMGLGALGLGVALLTVLKKRED